MTTEAKSELSHPLLALQPTHLTWDDWLQRWNSTPDVEGLMALLYCGFDVRVRNHMMPESDPRNDIRAERMIFYLKIADGWDQNQYFRTKEEEKVFNPPTWHESRVEISQKAMKMLTEKFFKDTQPGKREEQSWLAPLELPGVLEQVFEFFRPDNNYGNIGYDFKSFQGSTMRQFLSEFWLLSWQYDERWRVDSRGYYHDSNLKENNFRVSLTVSRPLAIGIGARLKQLFRLLELGCAPDTATLQALEKLVLNKHRYPSIERAMAEFVPAAVVLHAYNVILPERARQETQAQAEKIAKDEALRLKHIETAQQELFEKRHALEQLRKPTT